MRGERLLEVLADHGGFDDDGAVVHEHRHDRARIQREELGLELLAGEDVDVAPDPRQLFLGEREPHFRGACGGAVVVELQSHEPRF